MNAHVLKTFVIFVGYKVLYFLQENDILYQPGLEIFVGYEVLYFPQENDILYQPCLETFEVMKSCISQRKRYTL